MSSNDLCDYFGVFSAAPHFFESTNGESTEGESTQDSYLPTDSALSRWGTDLLNGPAVVGLAAWHLERDHGADGFLPARFTADLFKAARKVPTAVRTRLVRDGRRVRSADCEVFQDGAVVARATMVAYRASGPPPGREWVAPAFTASFPAPAGASGPVYFVGSDERGWDVNGAIHQNASRKRVYHRSIEVIAGQAASPFVRAVVAAEATSLVTNLGTHGIGYINGDLTVALSRLPVGDYIGVQADSHWCADGISVGGATLFDDVGPFGIGMVTAVANPAAQIDFGNPDPRTAVGVEMTGRDEVLISAEELMARADSVPAVAILDVRWRLDRPDGREDFLAGHIPGAVYVSLEEDLSDHSVSGRGRHPLPSGRALQQVLRRCGIRAGQPVVVYDDWNRAGSARAWWVLRAAGLSEVRILDGGLAAWTAASGEVRTGEVTVTPGDVTVAHPDLYDGAMPTLDADAAASLGEQGRLLDARAPERFRGEVEPVDAVAGHIPGARNLPSLAVLDGDGRFRSAEQISARLAEIGAAGPVGAYCGSGVTASVVVAALAAAGVPTALFPGSWSQWSAETGRPVMQGE